jgi:hypothetical protein
MAKRCTEQKKIMHINVGWNAVGGQQDACNLGTVTAVLAAPLQASRTPRCPSPSIDLHSQYIAHGSPESSMAARNGTLQFEKGSDITLAVLHHVGVHHVPTWFKVIF